MEALGVAVVGELGRGSSGVVYKVQNRRDGQIYVLKVVNFQDSSVQYKKNAQKEVEILSLIQHPHLIKYYSSLMVQNSLYILMEYASGGDLETFVQNQKQLKVPIEEDLIWNWAYEISLGIQYLHSKNIVHRDLKCMNLFLDKEGRVKIGDLGLSTVVGEQMLGRKIGTPLYLSPEQIRRQPYGLKVDIWAFGCVLYQMATLEMPFLGDTLITLEQNIVRQKPKALPCQYSQRLQLFVFQLLKKKEKNRPEAGSLMGFIPKKVVKQYRPPVVKSQVRIWYRSKTMTSSLPPIKGEFRQQLISHINTHRTSTSLCRKRSVEGARKSHIGTGVIKPVKRMTIKDLFLVV